MNPDVKKLFETLPKRLSLPSSFGNIEWSTKGSDRFLMFVGTKDYFKIRGLTILELRNFLCCYEHIGYIRSIPLFELASGEC